MYLASASQHGEFTTTRFSELALSSISMFLHYSPNYQHLQLCQFFGATYHLFSFHLSKSCVSDVEFALLLFFCFPCHLNQSWMPWRRGTLRSQPAGSLSQLTFFIPDYPLENTTALHLCVCLFELSGTAVGKYWSKVTVKLIKWISLQTNSSYSHEHLLPSPASHTGSTQ